MLGALSAKAHPYASGVQVTGGTTVTYHLNESVTNGIVAYLFDNGTVSNYVGGTAASPVTNGLQSFDLTGHTNFQIYVFNVGIGSPYQIDPNVPGNTQGPNPHGTNALVNFYGPRGVTVNRNPSSPYFGTIYVANNSTGPAGGRTTGYGFYALNGDFSDAFGYGSNAMPVAGTGPNQMRYGGSTTYAPYRVFVNKDDTLFASDASGIAEGNTVGGGVWMLNSTLTTATDMFLFGGSPTTNASGLISVASAQPQGSYEATNLVLYTCEYNRAQGYQAVFQYNFFSNNAPLPLPWNQFTMEPNDLPSSGSCAIPNPNGIVVSDFPGIDGVIADFWIAPDGKFFLSSERGNTSDTSLWVYDTPANGSCILFNSSATAQADGIQAGTSGTGDPFWFAYAVSVSDDDQFVATGTSSGNAAYGGPGGYIDICAIGSVNGVSGLPVEQTFYAIPYNTALGCTVRGVAFDKADNVYGVSGSDDSMRCFSLGLTTTCITGNDSTGTNGTFQLLLPLIQASVQATTPVASQNYGSPTPGVFTITLNTNVLTEPLKINYTLSGTAVAGTNYTVASTNSITIPAQTSASGNITITVPITPTAVPVIGPTTTVTLKLAASSAYLVGVPPSDTVYIANTGPQSLSISSTPGSTMYRGLTNDYVTFVITRLGDTNAGTYTVTNLTYGGTAVFGSDYLAGLQPIPTSSGTTLVPGNPGPGITISPGQVLITNIVGEPVPTPYGASPVGNKTIVLSLGTSTNQTSQENIPYYVTTNSSTFTLIDNALPPELVLWSDPLTNSAATNWNLTFADTNLGVTTVLPVIISNYANIGPAGTSGNPDANGTNDFDVEFGYSVANDSVGQSEAMLANHWTTALRVSVNKDGNFSTAAGVNLFPAGMTFAGSYALRFSMNLTEAQGNPIEYAQYGINTGGTNCDWIVQPNAPYGSGYTNQDGIFFLVASDQGGALARGGFPDFANQVGLTLPPNNSSFQVLDINGAITEPGVYKHPIPYTATGIGTPANITGSQSDAWADVEVKQVIYGTSNAYTMSINKTVVFTSTNTTPYTNGSIMLGYDDPYADNGVGPTEPAVYFSNVRVVEIAPVITNQPISLTVAVGDSATFTATATGVGPFTNLWYTGTSTLVQSNTVASSPDSTSLVIPSTVPTNAGTYFVTVSDASGGSVTSVPVTLVVVAPSSPKITSFGLPANGTNAVLEFTSPDQFDTTNSFNLQVSTNLDNPSNAGFVDDTNVVITETSNVFTITIPTNAETSFYRLQHK
jgi:hypothetical protein